MESRCPRAIPHEWGSGQRIQTTGALHQVYSYYHYYYSISLSLLPCPIFITFTSPLEALPLNLSKEKKRLQLPISTSLKLSHHLIPLSKLLIRVYTVCHSCSSILDIPTERKMDLFKFQNNYSRLPLSRPRLSRITVYLKVKFWSPF